MSEMGSGYGGGYARATGSSRGLLRMREERQDTHLNALEIRRILGVQVAEEEKKEKEGGRGKINKKWCYEQRGGARRGWVESKLTKTWLPYSALYSETSNGQNLCFLILESISSCVSR